MLIEARDADADGFEDVIDLRSEVLRRVRATQDLDNARALVRRRGA